MVLRKLEVNLYVQTLFIFTSELRARLVCVQRMPCRAATSAPQLRHAFGLLPHLRHAAALPWSSSVFWVPKRAGVATADFSAAVAARPNVRCGSFWTLSKRALTPLSAFTGIGANSIFNLKMQG